MDNNTQALVLLIKRQVLQMRQLRQFQWSLPEGTSGESTTMPSITSPEVQQAILDQVYSHFRSAEPRLVVSMIRTLVNE